MAYMQDKDLLFVHIPKNAGKSVEVALGLPGATDLSDLGRRSDVNRVATFLLRKTSNADARACLHGSLDVTLCAQHLTLQEIMLLDLIPREKRGNLKSFAVCRNPYSRALSSYKHFRNGGAADPRDFERFCETWYDESPKDHNTLAHQRQQIDFVLDTRGKPGVDKILRFETLGADFSSMCAEWGIDVPELPHIGKQGVGSGSYLQAYTDKSKAIITERFAEDLEFFGYEF